MSPVAEIEAEDVGSRLEQRADDVFGIARRPKRCDDFRLAMIVAGLIVIIELATITWIRNRYMDTPIFSAALQVGLGGVLVFLTGILIGSS